MEVSKYEQIIRPPRVTWDEYVIKASVYMALFAAVGALGWVCVVEYKIPVVGYPVGAFGAFGFVSIWFRESKYKTFEQRRETETIESQETAVSQPANVVRIQTPNGRIPLIEPNRGALLLLMDASIKGGIMSWNKATDIAGYRPKDRELYNEVVRVFTVNGLVEGTAVNNGGGYRVTNAMLTAYATLKDGER